MILQDDNAEIDEKVDLNAAEVKAKELVQEGIQSELEKQDTIHTKKDEHLILVGKKILWVEDDKFLGAIVSRRMSEYKCEIHLAKNGDEAYAYLGKEKKPDIIILDLVLPGVSGFDILKHIRDDATFATVPIMVLSNLNQSADIERAKILGAQKFMVKASASLDEIIKSIDALLKK